MSNLCKAIVDKTGKVLFDSAISNGTTLEEIIEEDKQYGIMTPRNGEYFTYRVEDWQNKWMSSKQLRKGIALAWLGITKVIDIKVKEAKANEVPDFTIKFRKTEDDQYLTSNTLMYHYYPIYDINDPNRGVCVVNADYTWTIDGKGIPLHIFDPEHYTEPVESTAETFDFDDIYVHEGPGHGLGLPHSPNLNTKMYGSSQGMANTIFDETPYETIPRLQAKYPKKEISAWHLFRWIRYLLHRRERY